MIDFFHLQTTIQQKYMIFYLFFFVHKHRLKNRVLIDLFLLFAHNHATKIYDHLSFIFSLCTTIQPKIMIFINLIFLFVRNNSTKVRGHSYSLIYCFLNFANTVKLV